MQIVTLRPQHTRIVIEEMADSFGAKDIKAVKAIESFQGSIMAMRSAVNRDDAGSSPASGATKRLRL